MKKIILFIGILACTFSLKATPNITAFQILGNYLFEGKLKVNSNNSSTSFANQISISRGQINQNGSYIDEPVDLTVEILNIDKNGVTHILATRRYTTSDFQGGFNKLETQSMTAEIPSSYYSGQIRVRYRYKFLDPNIENLYGKMSNDVYVGTTYQIITTKEIEERLPADGAFINVIQTGGVYIRIGDSLHPICCPEVLTGLFNFNMNMIVNVQENMLQKFKIGLSIDQNTSIIHYQGGLYLKQGTLVRPITSTEAFNKYHFKFIYTDVSNLNGLTVGTPIS